MAPVHRLLNDLGCLSFGFICGVFYICNTVIHSISGMKEEEIDEIVLVGGSTRIPRIKSQLR